MKPSGSSRYFRFDGDHNITRVDRAGVAPTEEQFDVQILAKRYECSDVPGFVRKLYIVRDKADEPRVNSHIAVLTYHWKSEPAIAKANRDAVISRKRQAEQAETQTSGRHAVLESADEPVPRLRRPMATDARVANGRILRPKALPMIDALSRIRLPHTDHLRRLALMKKSENLCRLAAILDRAEPIMERFEQYFLSNCHNVRQLGDNSAMWVEQPLNDQLVERGGVVKAADHEIEECVIVNEQGEPIELPPGSSSGGHRAFIGFHKKMTTPSRRRLMRDFKKLQEDPPAGVSGAPTEDNILAWEAIIFGPQDTPFEDGTFKLSLEFTEEYPNKPPTVKFISKMFHPNVYADGSICLDILQNRWSPTYDVAAILTSIQSLLDEPNPNSPANSHAAQLYQENRREYEKRVQQIVEQSWLNFGENEGDMEVKDGNDDTGNNDEMPSASGSN
ncbi:hypothetical protein GCK32_000966 [Trichostrongylus colubriformis]